jgi:glutamine synthetase
LSKGGKNIFFDKKDENLISKDAYKFIERIIGNAKDISLILNASVNAYRRLDPHFEAPNQIKYSPIDRTSMIRIPLGNEKSARIEVRSVGPDANPYMLFYSLVKTGMNDVETRHGESLPFDKKAEVETLPGHIYEAIEAFSKSKFTTELLGADVKDKYISVKEMSADRCAKALGTKVKKSEVIYHHEITNQYLWNRF